MSNAGCGLCRLHLSDFFHSSESATNQPRLTFTRDVAIDAEAYERAWRIELRAEELFKRDYPSGSFARRLPQFRSSYPDPVGDYYRRLAAKELSDR
jgi:hypothetical protein